MISTPSLNISTEKIALISPFFNFCIATFRFSVYSPLASLNTATDGIPLDENVNIVEFSKDKHNGRYGYLDGVYDVSDES